MHAAQRCPVPPASSRRTLRALKVKGKKRRQTRASPTEKKEAGGFEVELVELERRRLCHRKPGASREKTAAVNGKGGAEKRERREPCPLAPQKSERPNAETIFFFSLSFLVAIVERRNSTSTLSRFSLRPFESPRPFLPEYENDGDENTKTSVVRGAAAHDPSARCLGLPFLLCATILVTVRRAPPLLFPAAARSMAPSSMCQAFSV